MCEKFHDIFNIDEIEENGNIWNIPEYIKTTQQQLISILTLILPTILMVLEVLKAKRIFTNTCFVIGIS